MKTEPEEDFPEGWGDAEEDALFDKLDGFVQRNRQNICSVSPEVVAQNSFIEGFIAGYAYCGGKHGK